MTEIEELIQQLKDAAKKDLNISISLRAESPDQSRFFFKLSELMTAAAKELEKKKPIEKETEGGGSSWWYVCPECNGAIDQKDSFCRHCGQAVKV